MTEHIQQALNRRSPGLCAYDIELSMRRKYLKTYKENPCSPEMNQLMLEFVNMNEIIRFAKSSEYTYCVLPHEESEDVNKLGDEPMYAWAFYMFVEVDDLDDTIFWGVMEINTPGRVLNTGAWRIDIPDW